MKTGKGCQSDEKSPERKRRGAVERASMIRKATEPEDLARRKAGGRRFADGSRIAHRACFAIAPDPKDKTTGLPVLLAEDIARNGHGGLHIGGIVVRTDLVGILLG